MKRRLTPTLEWGVTTIHFWHPPPPRSPAAASTGPSYALSTRKYALAEAQRLAAVKLASTPPGIARIRRILAGRKVIGYDVVVAGERRHAFVVHEYDRPPFEGPRVGIWILKPL